MRVRLWGPIELAAGDTVFAVRPPQQAAVLVAVAVDAGRRVLPEVLLGRVWGTDPPAQARRTVHTYLTRIRRQLEQAGAAEHGVQLTHHAAGYLLELGSATVDLQEFRRLVTAARQPGSPAERQLSLLGAALALCRGEPLAGLAGDWAEQVREACRQQRLDAALAWADAALRCGRPEQTIDTLTDLVREHPLDESAIAMLMRTLHAAGRTADALARYSAARRRLAEELGIDPGPLLRQAHQSVLRGVPATSAAAAPASAAPTPARVPTRPVRAVPAQLPLDIPTFVGRDGEIARLDVLAAQPIAVVVVAMSGTAGVGKTALTVHWAHGVRDQFPDGQLYLNLRGYDPGDAAMPASEALSVLLAALDVAPLNVPTHLDAKAAFYRSALANRRMLIVLDNARDAEQVRPLLPASPGCVVLITSRSQLAGLAATAGAHLVNLDLLGTDEAHQLLTARLGQHRVGAEPAAVSRIISACSRLPLALAIAAARALARPELSLTALADDLTDARLDAFTIGDPAADARAVFSWSYRALTPPTARLFRLLGLHPGPDFGPASAANLAGLPPAETRVAIDELLRSHLLAHRGSDRFGFHDLLRAYARELADRHDAGPATDDALGRLYEYYIHHAQEAARTLCAHRPGLGDTTPREAVVVELLADLEQAQAWMTRECGTLVAAVGYAAAHGLDRQAWQVAWTIGYFLERVGWWKQWTDTTASGLAAATRLEDQYGEALLRDSAGDALTQLGDLEQATHHLRLAGARYEQLRDHGGIARIEIKLAIVCFRAGAATEALHHAGRAMVACRTVGDDVGQAHALHAIAWYHLEVADYRQAVALGERSVELHRTVGDVRRLSGSLDTLGLAYHRLGDPVAAVRCITESVEGFKRIDDRYHTAVCLVHLADSQQAIGDLDGARAAYTESLAIYEQLRHSAADEPRQRLHELDSRQPPAGPVLRPTSAGPAPTVDLHYPNWSRRRVR